MTTLKYREFGFFCEEGFKIDTGILVTDQLMLIYTNGSASLELVYYDWEYEVYMYSEDIHFALAEYKLSKPGDIERLATQLTTALNGLAG